MISQLRPATGAVVYFGDPAAAAKAAEAQVKVPPALPTVFVGDTPGAASSAADVVVEEYDKVETIWPGRARSSQPSDALARQPVRRDWVEIPDVQLGVSVADYADCAGRQPLQRSTAARDRCMAAPLVWLVGHNPGVFTPLLGLNRGGEVDYWDSSGDPQRYDVVDIKRLSAFAAASYATDHGHPHLVLQTCAVPDGSEVWLFFAEPV
jgi:hypothetical protein